MIPIESDTALPTATTPLSTLPIDLSHEDVLPIYVSGSPLVMLYV